MANQPIQPCESLLLAALAVACLAATTTGCGKPADAPAPTSAGRCRRRGRAAAAAGLRVRAAGRGARAPRRAVHRRSGPDGGAPHHPRRGRRQPDLLLRGQGHAARRRLRDGRGLRGLPEQEAQDQARDQGQRGLRAAAARPDGHGADPGQGRPGRGPGHRPAGAPGDRRLQRSRPHERQRSGRRPARARRRSPPSTTSSGKDVYARQRQQRLDGHSTT